MILDALVEQRLRDGGIVHFAVAVAAIADDVHHNVAAKCRAILRGKLSDAHDRVGIFRVDVKHRNALALGNVRSETRRMLLRRLRGEADEIVDDDVHGAADGVSLQVREIERFRQNALAGKRRVAVHHDRPNFVERFARAVDDRPVHAVTRLLGARAAHRHGIDRFQVARIRNKVHVDRLAAPWSRKCRSRRRDTSRRPRRARCADRRLQIRKPLRAAACTPRGPSRSSARDGSSP